MIDFRVECVSRRRKMPPEKKRPRASKDERLAGRLFCRPVPLQHHVLRYFNILRDITLQHNNSDQKSGPFLSRPKYVPYSASPVMARNFCSNTQATRAAHYWNSRGHITEDDVWRETTEAATEASFMFPSPKFGDRGRILIMNFSSQIFSLSLFQIVLYNCFIIPEYIWMLHAHFPYFSEW